MEIIFTGKGMGLCFYMATAITETERSGVEVGMSFYRAKPETEMERSGIEVAQVVLKEKI